MVRETRHLWVGNLPDNIREERIREHFKRYGRVQSVKLLPRVTKEETGEITMACTVAFMDIKSASKAHNAELKIDDRTLNTEYYEPAAIPSAASPQNTPSPYSTSPGTTRFPNGHGSSEEHGGAFPERFYDRSTTRVGSDSEFIRRTGYHETNRGRNRDRSYRNGPYNPLAIERHRVNNAWQYDNLTRYNNTNTGSQTETGYSTTPTDTSERRNSDQGGTKKKTKSRSGSRTPSPSGSTSSRSPSRSRSRSSSSSSSSSTSRDTSSTSSPKSRRLASSTTVVHSDDRRPLAICVKNLPLRSSDTSLKDGLFHEYKKHGKVTWVKVVGQSSERYAIVCFKKPEDVEKALEVSYDKLFFGCKIEVAPYMGYDVEDNDLRPYEAEIDEFHPKATRTLFIGNLEKDVTASDLRKHFDQFGEIIEIDIKKQGVVSSYAFCQYSDIVSVVKAIRKMDGEHLGNNRIKLGFGKSMPTNCVWVDGVGEHVTEKYLKLLFEPYGVVNKLHVDREKGQALISYEQVVAAQSAVNKMRGFSLKNSKIQVDFASRECQESFFEHLEKQGTVLDRTVFDERRDSTSRSFDSNRFSRYDTPTRPRTSSYSSRSSVTASQITSAIPSPGTPGSVTPRGTGSRSSRTAARFTEYYDQANPEYPERHFRNYDEYSQGSPASHEDGYEHEYAYNSPTHLDPMEARSLQSTDTSVPFAPPDIRNLQKERVHLLEQLEECPSSGDEVMSPKKRLKLDMLEAAVAGDVIVEANRDHRKVMEVRRLSDAANLKHHSSRRPSIDSGKHLTGGTGLRDLGHERNYLPHAICKRRKTANSDQGGTKVHHYDHSGSESVSGSRPGTPLCDERPENFQPSEPRRIPREREGPLTLPLPRFASQIINRGSVSVAGIKGQKDNVLCSPPAAVTSPRISNPRPPSPIHVPPPASPPPRPPSLSSNSSDSDGTPPSPSLEERIRSLDEKYEKWSGTRALSAAGGGALVAMMDANREKFKSKHKLLHLDLKEVQPSEIVKSVMAKRSVFDEDLKRLENVGEKYEPKEFNLFPSRAAPTAAQTTVPATPVPATTTPPATLKLAPVITPPPQPPKTPTIMLSPRSAGVVVPAAKGLGLQYPFPSHPPPMHLTTVSPSTPPPPTTAVTPTTTTTSTTARSNSHGDNRLKSCVSASSDNRTSSKVNVNRTTIGPIIIKTSEKNIIPNTSEVCTTSMMTTPTAATATTTASASVDQKHVKTVREVKPSTDKIAGRRDSNSTTSSSPRPDTKTRRNSDTNIPATTSTLIDDQRLEKARLENERLEREKAEKERLEKELIEKEKQERERLEKERLEKERLERESELEKQRLEKERLEKERLEKEKLERERKLEQERLERKEKEELEQRLEKEREQHEKEEREKREAEEQKEKERKRDEERSKHKEDNHEKRKDEHRHRENHSSSETKHNRDNHVDKNLFEKNTKDNHESSRSSHEKSKHHVDRDAERRKESIKENRDNNIHDKHKNFSSEIKERATVESRHLSLDMDRSKIFENNLNKQDLNKRKERNNSLPGNISNKRRISSHDSLENADELKRIKLNPQDHKKLSERRDSKDSNRSEDKTKSNFNKHKNNSIKSHDKHNSSSGGEKLSEERQRQKDKEREERHKNKHKLEKQKLKSKSRESPSTPKSPTEKDFFTRLDLRSNEEIEKHQQRREEKREKYDDRLIKKEKQSDKSSSKPKEETTPKSSDEQRKMQKRIRKMTQNSSDNSDSDEPKKHSIFDIVDDEPAYISMYDKVKARSCKNMQKQEEEKRQEKIKAKFSQLKQSRAKREEKKRSTSWDEDSDSDMDSRADKSEMRVKRIPKIIASSDDDDQERNSRKKDLYSDTDSDNHQHRPIKSEHDTSEDDRIRTKNSQFKGCKSRIASDSSDDDYKKAEIKSELFSDIENDQGFADSEEKPYSFKDELERVMIKKERQNNRHKELTEQIFGDLRSPDITSEKFNNRHSFGDNSSDDYSTDLKKDRSESRKKHKKKQKRQKHSLSSEESCKLESVVESIQSESNSEKSKHHDKKRQHSKKDKKRDKTKDERDKSKKSKKSKSDSKSDSIKRDDKMEKFFGSLSEDSENGIKEKEPEVIIAPPNSFTNKFSEETLVPKTPTITAAYNSESDRETTESKLLDKEKEREKEEHKKRKEKKRREKERRLQQEAAAVNDASMDYADMAKQLEANIKDETDDAVEEFPSVKTEPESTVEESAFKFQDLNEIPSEFKKDERKENKEKKKKRKKSKEEKQKHHHHHHHDKDKDKSKTKTVEEVVKKEPHSVEDIKIEIEDIKANTLEVPSTPKDAKTSPNLDLSISPITREAIISPIPKTPTTSKDKKRESKIIPGFGSEIDESAVKSICDFVQVKEETPAIKVEEPSVEKPVAIPTVEEKPRVVISQEETEDAVAALLGESFGETQFEECCYTEEIPVVVDQSSSLTEDNNVQDDEEMRQAVQSLSATDLDVKPETPQSEHELQIDTDTDEQEEISLRYDQPPKTPDMADLLRPPKTPDIPSYFRNNTEDSSKAIAHSSNVAVVKPTTTTTKIHNIGSPPSLTPIKPLPAVVAEVKKNLDQQDLLANKSLPLLPEQHRSVISQSWSVVEKRDASNKVEVKPEPIKEAPIKTMFNTPPMVKIEHSSFPTLSKPHLSPISEPSKIQALPKLDVCTATPTLHNLPARSPLQIKPSPIEAIVQSTPKALNRLPITPVMASKPLQPTTVILPQAKLAHSIDPPKLVSASDHRLQPTRMEPARMVYPTSTIQTPYTSYMQTQPRMVVQPFRPLPPSQGLLVPSRHMPPNNYSAFNYNVPPQLTTKEPEKLPMEPLKLSPVPVPSSLVSSAPNTSSVQPSIIISKPYMPVIQETLPPKLINLSSSNVIKPLPQIETSNEFLKVAETSRTSTPSPVIVANPKENILVPEVKIEKVEVPPEAPSPVKLAIEAMTVELNESLKKDDIPVEVVKEPVKIEPKIIEEASETSSKEVPSVLVDQTVIEQPQPAPIVEPVSVIREIEKFDEEKADSESTISDISKERSSADILTKDDPLDTKEDSDYWSAKEVNIDSVIKTLCSGDELSDHSSEIGKDEWFDDAHQIKAVTKIEVKEDAIVLSPKIEEPIIPDNKSDDFDGLDEGMMDDEEKEVSARGARRGGRGGRGRKPRGGGAGGDRGGIQTRRGKAIKDPVPPVKRGGRGGRPKNERKIIKSDSENTSTDIYEFRDDFDDTNKERPRLILTIKSPAVSNANSTTAIVKEVAKELVKEAVKEDQIVGAAHIKPVESKEEFISPAANTRKSRRLQERDVSRNNVDDTIEDVVKNTIQTRAAAAAALNLATATTTPRRSGRQPVPKQPHDVPRKSPRGGRKKDRRASDTTDDSSEEKPVLEPVQIIEKPIVKEEKPGGVVVVVPKPAEVPLIKEKPHEGLKATMLRRIKGEMNEPTNLIDPVTGLITPMRECEEGRYIPLPGSNNEHRLVITKGMVKPVDSKQPSVITSQVPPQQVTVVQQPKPQSLKAHVLSSQAAKAATAVVHHPDPPAATMLVTKPTITPPINQHLNVNVSMAMSMQPTHLSPKPQLSPNQMATLSKQQMLQANKQLVNKSHIVPPQMAHLKQQQPVLKQQQQQQQQVIISKTPMVKPSHQMQHLTGSIASPPLGAKQRVLQGGSGPKGVMEPPKIDVGAVMLGGQRAANLSPQGQAAVRLAVQTAGLPAYEASLGEAITHFSPGSVPLRSPHELPPAHYMHPSHVMQYQQFLRQSPYMSGSRIVPVGGGLEKTVGGGDGQEGEEAPVTSPPLELRRPGSVGLALTGRGAAVPHSLHSPHDRATDSPQVGQVYNVHSSRLQHYHSNRYYDQAATTEPPPAHRPLTSHGSLTALGSDRPPISHMSPLGNPDRPLSSHIQPDRPLSTHMGGGGGGLPTTDRSMTSLERPMSAHSLLGAAGNLMGAVARHVPAADAPTSQRGLQAATPPHASQVPPQAESLFMLLKQYPCMWQGLLALKNDQAAVQMYFVSGNDEVAKCSLPKNMDGSTPPLRIFQRMRLEPPQVEGVARKMQMENEHCMLLALPCGHDHMDVLKQSTNLTCGFITYLQQKQAAGIVNVAAPGTTQPPAYVVHIFPSCDFVNENLRRIAPSLLERVADIAHLLIVITTV